MMMEMDDLIELMEGELCEDEMHSMEMMFRHAASERRAFLAISRMRDAVLASDPLAKVPAEDLKKVISSAYQKKFTKKIMKGIMNQAQPAVVEQPVRVALKTASDPSHS